MRQGLIGTLQIKPVQPVPPETNALEIIKKPLAQGTNTRTKAGKIVVNRAWGLLIPPTTAADLAAILEVVVQPVPMTAARATTAVRGSMRLLVDVANVAANMEVLV